MTARCARSFSADSRGSISILMVMSLTVLIGAAALGVEVSAWFMMRHNLQNAADTAAIAASMNGRSNYDTEAKAVTALYGLVDGTDGVTVTPSNTAACPTGGANCYSVTITQAALLFLAPVIGYTGNVVVNGQNGVALGAMSVVSPATQYCILALGKTGAEGILTNGAPKANLSGCNVMSNTSSTCHGSNLQADIGNAHTTNTNCGTISNSNMPIVPDPYAQLATQIPPNNCLAYPQEPSKNGIPLPSSNLLSGSLLQAGSTLQLGTQTVCGDLQLTSDVTLSGPGSTLLVIVNGRLDLNGYTLKTAPGASITVVFTGSNSANYIQTPTGSGTLDITAPTSGPWAGVAIYQDPKLTISSAIDIAAAGNSPTWDITGLVYLPNAYVLFSGAVNKSSNGNSCFVLVVDHLRFNGTGSILSHGGCASAGLVMPVSRPSLLN